VNEIIVDSSDTILDVQLLASRDQRFHRLIKIFYCFSLLSLSMWQVELAQRM